MLLSVTDKYIRVSIALTTDEIKLKRYGLGKGKHITTGLENTWQDELYR